MDSQPLLHRDGSVLSAVTLEVCAVALRLNQSSVPEADTQAGVIVKKAGRQRRGDLSAAAALRW